MRYILRSTLQAIIRGLTAEGLQSDLELVQMYLNGRDGLFLGSYVDFAARRLVVVVDPADAEELEGVRADLEEVTASASVTVRPGCRDRDALVAVLDDVTNAVEHREAGGAVARVHPATGSVLIDLETGQRERAEQLRAKHGEQVDVRTVPAATVREAAGGRTADVQAHYGGSYVRFPDQNPVRRCTTSFAVTDNYSGGRSMLTAGHCAAYGEPVENGQNQFYGWVLESVNNTADLARVGSSNRLYSRNVWTDGGTDTRSWRQVDRKVLDPWIGMAVCLSGADTLFTCDQITVRELDLRYQNTSGQWRYGQYRVRSQNNVGIGSGGDSGGPAIGRHGDTASARGLINAGGDPLDPNVPDQNLRDVYLTPIRMVESVLEVTVATAGGDASS